VLVGVLIGKKTGKLLRIELVPANQNLTQMIVNM
jgi:hypothetical protein